MLLMGYTYIATAIAICNNIPHSFPYGVLSCSQTGNPYTGYDSDVAREKAMDYSNKTYANPIRGSKGSRGVKPHQRDYDDDDDE